MLVPKTAEYAIRCMAQLALLPGSASISADQLHDLVGVPRDYLSKILRKLTRARLLSGERGHGGGFRIAKPLSEISFLMVLKATGFSFDPDHCAFGWGSCDLHNPCPLHEAFSSLNRKFFEWASKTTLADVKGTKKFLDAMKKHTRRTSGSGAISQAKRRKKKL